MEHQGEYHGDKRRKRSARKHGRPERRKKNAFIGPCPPSGTHHYHFHLYALDALLEIPETSGKTELEAAIEAHLIEETELIGLYQKQQ